LRVGVANVLCGLERLGHDLLRTLELARVRERVAQQRREPSPRDDVLGRFLLDVRQALLEDLDGALRHADQRIRAAER
jgi:hypothetical protein